jgi:membrane AbrB-like protein
VTRLGGVARALAALAACSVGGAVCFLLHTPLPWMTGALVTMAALKFAGLPVAAPRGGRETGQILIATALGLYFTPTVAREVLGRWELLVAAAVFATVLSYVGAWMISRWSDTDRTTAFFASVPGGATEMMHLGERFGARPDRIAVAQSLRILIVVITVPVVMTWWGAQGTEDYVAVVLPFDGRGLALLLACTIAGGFALWFVGSPNPFMLGALLVATGLTLAEVQWSSVPTPVVNAAQVLLGCNLGSRFERTFVRGAPRFVLVVVASIVAGIAISAGFAVALAWWSGLPVATMVLATAPGGIAEMCITAKVLQLGVPLVTAAHVTRVIILVTTTGPLFRLLRRVVRRSGPG